MNLETAMHINVASQVVQLHVPLLKMRGSEKTKKNFFVKLFLPGVGSENSFETNNAPNHGSRTKGLIGAPLDVAASTLWAPSDTFIDIRHYWEEKSSIPLLWIFDNCKHLSQRYRPSPGIASKITTFEALNGQCMITGPASAMFGLN